MEKDGPGWKADIPIPTRFTIKITGGSFTWRNSNKDKVWDKLLIYLPEIVWNFNNWILTILWFDIPDLLLSLRISIISHRVSWNKKEKKNVNWISEIFYFQFNDKFLRNSLIKIPSSSRQTSIFHHQIPWIDLLP